MRPKIIGIAGGSASGKSSLARHLAGQLGSAALIVLDDFFRTDREDGAWTAPDAQGRQFFDLNHTDAFAWSLVFARLDELCADAAVKSIVLEGNFALYPAQLRERLSLGVFVLVPDDVRLGRKIVRNYTERGQPPAVTVQNYLNSARAGHEQFVSPTMRHADLILNGEKAVDTNAALLLGLIQWR